MSRANELRLLDLAEPGGERDKKEFTTHQANLILDLSQRSPRDLTSPRAMKVGVAVAVVGGQHALIRRKFHKAFARGNCFAEHPSQDR